jgi:phytoene dehydrogenase-like protein
VNSRSLPVKSHYDAVVVGAGHNGLVAASYLARAGLSVLVLERSAELGGATQSRAIFPGMDAYLSRYSYLISLFPRAIVQDLGLNFNWRRRAVASCTPFQHDGQHGALLLSNVDERASQAAVEALAGAEEWRGYQRLLEMEQALAALVWPSLIQPLRTRRQWEDSLSTSLQRNAWEALVEHPLGETLESLLRDDLVRGLVFTDAKIGLFTHPHDETLLQNRCFLLHTIGHGTGEWQVPVGGMGALVAELTRVAQASGATLLSQAKVQAIHPGAQQHAVVFVPDSGEGETITVETTRVLVSSGPQVFAQLLGIPRVPACGDEGSVAKVNMLLTRLPRLKAANVDSRDAFGGTFHINESYEEMRTSYSQAAAGQLPARPPAEIYCHTLTDDSILGPDLRQAGYQTLTLFGLDAPYRLFKEDTGQTRASLLARYLRDLNEVLAEPIEECLARDSAGQLCLEIKTPSDLERELALNLGNIFHAAPSWFFVESGDTQPAGTWGVETAFPRIYRCGSSALRGGGVSGIPGHNAARQIFAELRRPWPDKI